MAVKSGVTLTCNTDQMDEGNPPPSYTIWTKVFEALQHDMLQLIVKLLLNSQAVLEKWKREKNIKSENCGKKFFELILDLFASNKKLMLNYISVKRNPRN